MSADKVRSSKLKFKGEKAKKKRKHEDGEEGPSRRRRKDEDEESADTWVLPENANEIRGPTFIIHPSDPSPICLTYDSTRGRIVLQSVDKDKAEDSESPPIPERTPTDVSQVWVVTRIAGTTTINLRTGVGEGKFISCDKHGLVSADREARGPQEEWTPVVFPDGMVAFQNVFEKYLSVDEVAGGQLALRGDSDEVGFGERFWVKIQNKYKKEAHAEEKKRKDGLIDMSTVDEASTKCVFASTTAIHLLTHCTSKLYQAWGAGRSIVSAEDKKTVRILVYCVPLISLCMLCQLKRAKKDGRLAEELLDRRAKLKRYLHSLYSTNSTQPLLASDRFC